MAAQLQESNEVRLAIEGCGHGTLHAIYASIEEACKQKGWPGIDLLIIGGDFQSVRNAFDLNCVSMPPKYRSMCDFHEYYSGQRTAPYLTIFVGGNHEASNYLFELYHGGWVAPNIYYMGAANVLRLGPLRIAGLSGIWKGFDYRKPHFERLPYNESDMKSIYHVREVDVRKLLQIRTQVDVGVSHDWPQGVEWKGDWKKLFRFKKFFEEDARSGKLGSVAAKQVLDRLRPKYWFSAHLHCKFAAVIQHEDQAPSGTSQSAPAGTSSFAVPSQNKDEVDLNGEEATDGDRNIPPAKNADEIDLDLDDDEAESESVPNVLATQAQAIEKPGNEDEIDLDLDGDEGAGLTTNGSPAQKQNGVSGEESRLAAARAALPASFAPRKQPEPMEHPADITNTETNFLALDKCLPNRDFLQLISASSKPVRDESRPLRLQYDREWLSITRAFARSEATPLGDTDARVPPVKSQAEYRDLIDAERAWVDQNIDDAQLNIPENFVITAPVYDGGKFQDPEYQQVKEFPNPQAADFCRLLQIPNPLEISDEELSSRLEAGPRPETEFHGGRGRGRDGFRGDRGGRGRGRGRGGGGGGRGRFRGRGS
ncbi:putative calcineurin-like phosphoesterase domain, ApaH type, lariat debranching enzyme [Septoria linicola]|nr:putative calcineurin-like phosphoesterase domain, ApaH type, lariat debranching enzyme [Septoria linicola]